MIYPFKQTLKLCYASLIFMGLILCTSLNAIPSDLAENQLTLGVADTLTPRPVCISGKAIELLPVIPIADVDGDNDLDPGAVIVWATDFIDSLIIDDATVVLDYSINPKGEIANPRQNGLLLTCDFDASFIAEIWVWDEKGNSNFCETYILVQSNLINDCGNQADPIVGVISTEELSTVAGVQVSINSDDGGSVFSMVTGDNGLYQIPNIEKDYSYTITPFLDKNPLNGVSTFDLTLISKHILGSQRLDSPYKMIAADVNNSKSISVSDVIELRRLILNINSRFRNNTSWRFIAADYQFPDPQNPWQTPIPETIQVDGSNVQNLDFVAIKIGDTSLDAKTKKP